MDDDRRRPLCRPCAGHALRRLAGRRGRARQGVRARQSRRRHRRLFGRRWRGTAPGGVRLGRCARRDRRAGVGSQRAARGTRRRLPQRLADAQPGIRLPARGRGGACHGGRPAGLAGGGRVARRRERRRADLSPFGGRRHCRRPRSRLARGFSLLPPRHRRRLRRGGSRRPPARSRRAGARSGLRLATCAGERHHAGTHGGQPDPAGADRLQHPRRAAVLRDGDARLRRGARGIRGALWLPAAVRGHLRTRAGARQPRPPVAPGRIQPQAVSRRPRHPWRHRGCAGAARGTRLCRRRCRPRRSHRAAADRATGRPAAAARVRRQLRAPLHGLRHRQDPAARRARPGALPRRGAGRSGDL